MGISYAEKFNNNFMSFMQGLYGDFDERKVKDDKFKFDANIKIVKRIKMKDARKDSAEL